MYLTRWTPVAIIVFLISAFCPPSRGITYVQSQTTALGTGGNNTATFSAQPAAGDAVVAGVVCYGPSGCTITSITDNFSNSYTKIGPTASYGGPTQNVTNVALYCASAISTGSNFQVTATLSNSTGDSNLYIAEYSGVTCNVDQSASGSETDGSNTTLLQTSSATTTNAADLLVVVGGSSTGGAATAGTGYQLRQNGNNGVAEYGGFEDETVTTTGSYSASMTVASNTTYWAMVMVALKGSAGGGSPSITSFTPTSGPVGTSVTITGTNLTGATAVKFNGTAATSFTVNSSTQITATVPSGSTTGTISVTTASGTGTSTATFTVTTSGGAISYVQSQTTALGSGGNNAATFSTQPTAGDTIVAGVVCYGPNVCQISSITDNFGNTYSQIGPTAMYGGPTTNGTPVALYCASGISSGSNFTVTATLSNSTGDSNLYIAEYSGVTCSVDQSASGSETDGSNTTLLQTSSATTTNAADLLVAVGGSSTGGAATAGTGYHLRQNGNNGVAENGGFEDQIVASTGSYSGSMTVASNTTYWAMVMVALKGSSSGGATPTVTSFSPTSGSIGTSVTITGTNFTGATAVKFNGTTATSFTVNSSTQITATVPSGATTGTISVTTPSGTGTSSSTFTVSAPAPTVTSFTPTSGAVGTSVTITGTNFTGATAVKFNGTAVTSFTVNSSTQITTTVPNNATTGPISVTTPSGTGTSSSNFTVSATPVPSITSLSAVGGSGGSSLTISGSFGSVQGTVLFQNTDIGGNTSAAITTWTSTSILVQVPSALPIGLYNVQVVNSAGSSNTEPFWITGAGCPANW